MRELRIHQPEIYQLSATSYADTLAQFEAMPNISIDYAVAEEVQNGKYLEEDDIVRFDSV
ncbi:hypothetical protein [Pelosinus baikalensis]|uniref:Uncharacterized protein n=1 Tax=Pelosinus baikalensis TaxID=2892015 RepID=A0ABS8HPA5_9FIRM|nr:hypothetical protein [Pelosinus baikalensis]MCC5464078.1 hypothetical protein [Pelosinus baikalensis]